MNTNPQNKGYSAQFDAYYDLDSGEWLESNCGDKECEFCSNRPENAYSFGFVNSDK